MFEVIKYEGDNSNLVYRYPVEDFNTKSRLVVQQSQEAIFYYKGQIADRFDTPGTYILESQNIPIIRHLVNLPFGKESPFHAVVYFINRTEQMNNRWGVGSIPYVDPSYSLPIKTGLSGEYSFKVADSQTLLNKLVGTLSEFSSAKVGEVLNSFLKSRIIYHMSNYYKNNIVDLLTIETQIQNIVNALENELKKDFFCYGIEITKFIITAVVKEEDSPEYRRYLEFRTQEAALIDIKNRTMRDLSEADAAKQVEIKNKETEVALQGMQQDIDARGIIVDSQAQATKRQQEGYNYILERAYDVAYQTAQNEGVGNFASTGMGIGIGLGTMGAAAQTVGGIYSDALSNINLDVNKSTEKQKFAQETDLFSGIDLGIDNDITQKSDKAISYKTDKKPSKRERLQELKELFEDGLITQEEFDAKKKSIIDEV